MKQRNQGDKIIQQTEELNHDMQHQQIHRETQEEEEIQATLLH